jgi:hypothetical protein
VDDGNFNRWFTRVDLSFDCLQIPILAKYYPLPWLSIDAGLQPGFVLQQSALYFYYKGRGDIPPDMFSTWLNLNKFNLSIPVGLTCKISRTGLQVNGRYVLRMTRIADVKAKSKSSAFQFGLGYML